MRRTATLYLETLVVSRGGGLSGNDLAGGDVGSEKGGQGHPGSKPHGECGGTNEKAGVGRKRGPGRGRVIYSPVAFHQG